MPIPLPSFPLPPLIFTSPEPIPSVLQVAWGRWLPISPTSQQVRMRLQDWICGLQIWHSELMAELSLRFHPVSLSKSLSLHLFLNTCLGGDPPRLPMSTLGPKIRAVIMMCRAKRIRRTQSQVGGSRNLKPEASP